MADFTAYKFTFDDKSPDNKPLTGADVRGVLESDSLTKIVARATFPLVSRQIDVPFTESSTVPGRYSADLIPNSQLPGTRWRIDLTYANGRGSSFFIDMPGHDVDQDGAADIVVEGPLPPSAGRSLVRRLYDLLDQILVAGGNVAFTRDSASRTITIAASGGGSGGGGGTPGLNTVGFDQLAAVVRREIRESVDIDAISISDDSLVFISHDGTAKTIELQGAVEDNVRDFALKRYGTAELDAAIALTPSIVELNEFRGALVKSSTYLATVNLNLTVRNTAVLLGAALPTMLADREMTILVRTAGEPPGMLRFDLADLMAKPAAAAGDALSSTNALDFRQDDPDDNHYFLGHTGTHFLFGSDTGDLYQISLTDHVIDCTPFVTFPAPMPGSGGGTAGRLDPLAALPAAAGIAVGSIANLGGVLWELVDDTEDANLVSGEAAARTGNRVGTDTINWAVDAVPTWYIPKTSLPAPVPSSTAIRFRDARGFVFEDEGRRLSGSDTAAAYAYRGVNLACDTPAGTGFSVRFYRWVSSDFGTAIAVHGADRWELFERDFGTLIDGRISRDVQQWARDTTTDIPLSKLGNAPSGGGGGLTAEQVQDQVGLLLEAGDDAGADVDATYNDAANSLSLNIKADAVDPAKVKFDAGTKVAGRTVKLNADATGFLGDTVDAPPAKATNADVDAETDDAKFVTVAKLFRGVARKVRAATKTIAGIVELASNAELDAGTDDVKAVTPAGARRITGAKVSPAERTAGTESGVRRFSPEDVKSMVDSHAPSGGTTLQKATDSDVDAETNDTKYVTVANIYRAIARKVRAATKTVAGILEIATNAELDAGTDDAKAVTPAGLRRVTGPEASAAEIQAGTESAVRRMSPADLKAAVEEHAPAGTIGGGAGSGLVLEHLATTPALSTTSGAGQTTGTGALVLEAAKAAEYGAVINSSYHYGLNLPFQPPEGVIGMMVAVEVAGVETCRAFFNWIGQTAGVRQDATLRITDTNAGRATRYGGAATNSYSVANIIYCYGARSASPANTVYKIYGVKIGGGSGGGSAPAPARSSFLLSKSPEANVDITAPARSAGGGYSDPWTDIAALPALTAAQAGLLDIDGDVHAVAQTAGADGGDRIVVESRILRVRGAVETSLTDHTDYMRHIQPSGSTSTAYAAATNIADETLNAKDMGVAGDVYKLQARIIEQKTSGTPSVVRFPTGTPGNLITAAPQGGVKGDPGDGGRGPLASGNTFPTAPTEGQRFELLAQQTVPHPAEVTPARTRAGTGDQLGWDRENGHIDLPHPGIDGVFYYDDSSVNPLTFRNRYVVTRAGGNAKTPMTLTLGGTAYPLTRTTAASSFWRTAVDLTDDQTAGEVIVEQITYTDGTKEWPDKTFEPHIYVRSGAKWIKSSELSPDDIRDALASLSGEDRLSARYIKDLPARKFVRQFDVIYQGLSITSSQQDVVSGTTAFAPASEFNLNTVGRGELEFEVVLHLSNKSVTTLSIGDDGNDSVIIGVPLTATGLRGRPVYVAGGVDEGIQVANNVPVKNGATEIAQYQVWIEHQADGTMLVRSAHKGGTPTAQSYNVAAEINGFWSPTDADQAPTYTTRGRLLARSIVLPTAAVARGVMVGNPTGGGGTHGQKGWLNLLASLAGKPATGWKQAGASSTFPPGSGYKLFPPGVPLTPNIDSILVVTKVGTTERRVFKMAWGGAPLTVEADSSASDYAEAPLFFRGPGVHDPNAATLGPQGSGASARLLFRYVTSQAGAGEIQMWGDGTPLPANCTVEVYESGIFVV